MKRKTLADNPRCNYLCVLLLIIIFATSVLVTSVETRIVLASEEHIKAKFEHGLWNRIQALEAGEATRQILLIMRLSDNPATHTTSINWWKFTKILTDRHNATIRWAREWLSPWVIAWVPAEEVKTIAAYDFVARLGDGEIKGEPTLDISTKAISAYVSRVNLGYNGSGIKLALLDTGIRDEHPAFLGKRIVFNEIHYDREVTKEATNTSDHPLIGDISLIAHGTHCAGIAVGSDPNMTTYWGVAPGVTDLIIADIYYYTYRFGVRYTVTDAAHAIAGLKWAESKGAQIVSMSFRLDSPNGIYDGNDTLSQAIDEVVDNGVVVVAAADNNGPQYGTISVPGVARNAITVGAMDDEDTLNSTYHHMCNYSSRGPTDDGRVKPDVVAPAGEPWGNIYSPGTYLEGYSDMGGTSAATPHVAGVAALILQKHSDWTSRQVKENIMNTANGSWSSYTYDENTQGRGLVDTVKALTEPNITTPDYDLYMDAYYYEDSETYPLSVNVTVTGYYSGDLKAEGSTWLHLVLDEAIYRVIVVSAFLRDGYMYFFDHWDDNSTAPQRKANLINGTTASAYYQRFYQGSGCPFVYTWNGSEYLMDNNLLPASEGSGEDDVEDNYVLQQSFAPRNDKYKLMIGEFEQEHSYFDKVNLLAVDHASDVNVAVSPTGEILTYKDPSAPLSAFDRDGNDVLSLIQEVDEDYYEGYPGDYLLLDFGDLDIEDGAKLVLRADPPPQEKWSIYVQVRNTSMLWETVAIVLPRVYWSTEIVDLSSWLPDPDGDLKVKLIFTTRHGVDFAGLDTTPQEDYTLHEGNLLWAIHSEQGFVGWKLRSEDQVYAELLPGQTIRLKFYLVPQDDPEDERTFILYCKGRYFTIP
jgi:subtilisin family serine protease